MQFVSNAIGTFHVTDVTLYAVMNSHFYFDFSSVNCLLRICLTVGSTSFTVSVYSANLTIVVFVKE